MRNAIHPFYMHDPYGGPIASCSSIATIMAQDEGTPRPQAIRRLLVVSAQASQFFHFNLFIWIGGRF